jgi:hypothetical protein
MAIIVITEDMAGRIGTRSGTVDIEGVEEWYANQPDDDVDYLIETFEKQLKEEAVRRHLTRNGGTEVASGEQERIVTLVRALATGVIESLR